MSFDPYTTEEIAERRGKVDGTNFDRKLVDVDGKKYEVKEKDVADDATVPDTRPYKVYTALLSQQPEGSVPDDTILENTLGGVPIWSRPGSGSYRITLSGAFTINKTVVFFGEAASGTPTFLVTAYRESANYIDFITSTGDDYLTEDSQISIEIRVYN